MVRVPPRPCRGRGPPWEELGGGGGGGHSPTASPGGLRRGGGRASTGPHGEAGPRPLRDCRENRQDHAVSSSTRGPGEAEGLKARRSDSRQDASGGQMDGRR